MPNSNKIASTQEGEVPLIKHITNKIKCDGPTGTHEFIPCVSWPFMQQWMHNWSQQ